MASITPSSSQHPELPTTALQPPFPESVSLIAPDQVILPAAVPSIRGQRRGIVLPSRDLPAFLSQELRTPRLDALHAHLWLAGLPQPARPLHRQRMMNRVVFPTERPDEHLVWHQTRILLKPLPDFLLCHAFWAAHLCTDPGLHASAVGLLLSYTWLIAHRGDFDLALKEGLLPSSVRWERWTALAGEFLQAIDLATLAGVDRRYRYSELRLSRLNSLSRYLVPAVWSFDNLVFGYIRTSTWYTAFFDRHFGWLLAVFVYFTVVLSGLQVGLATADLAGTTQFQNLSYGAAVVSVAAVFGIIAAMLIVWFVLFWYHLLSTIAYATKVERDREKEIQARKAV